MNNPEDSNIYHPVGIIHSPFRKSIGTPIQPIAGMESEAILEIYPEYAEGLKDIEGIQVP